MPNSEVYILDAFERQFYDTQVKLYGFVIIRDGLEASVTRKTNLIEKYETEGNPCPSFVYGLREKKQAALDYITKADAAKQAALF